MVELLHRFCRTRQCVYVESDLRGGKQVHCFQDFQGRRVYWTAEEILNALGVRRDSEAIAG